MTFSSCCLRKLHVAQPRRSRRHDSQVCSSRWRGLGPTRPSRWTPQSPPLASSPYLILNYHFLPRLKQLLVKPPHTHVCTKHKHQKLTLIFLINGSPPFIYILVHRKWNMLNDWFGIVCALCENHGLFLSYCQYTSGST